MGNAKTKQNQEQYQWNYRDTIQRCNRKTPCTSQQDTTETSFQHQGNTNIRQNQQQYQQECCTERPCKNVSYQSNTTEISFQPQENPLRQRVCPVTSENQAKSSVPTMPTDLPLKNKPGTCMFRLPEKFDTKADLLINWLTWREEFESYRKGMLSIKQDNDTNWVLLLLNRMGPIGQEVYKTFIFTNSRQMDIIEIVLQKFDCYVIFNTRKKQWNESVDAYVQALREMITNKCSTWSEIYKDKLIIEQIFQEFGANELTKIAETTIPSFLSDINTLSLPQIIKLVKNIIAERETASSQVTAGSKQCSNCGQWHSNETDKCPAYGQRCRRCKNLNHFAANCSSMFVIDCDFCGYNHRMKECPAYGYTCTNCNKKHHFERKCRAGKPLLLKNCKFCGYEHIASRTECPATDHKCTTCGKLGHFPLHCEYLKK